MPTGISWTDETWNPIRGCTVVSPGCTHCYAMAVAARFSGPGLAYEGLAEKRHGHAVWTGKVVLVEKHLEDPLHWRAPRRIFVNSMSDLFHESVPDEWLDRIFDVMEQATQHQFQILTKRPQRMYDYVVNRFIQQETVDPCRPYWPDRNTHIWLGVSVEDQRRADERIPVLLGTPGAVKFLSCEPLLGPVDLERYLDADTARCFACENEPADYDCGCDCHTIEPLHWVIVGGESGRDYREMDLEWARSLRDQCVAAEVPFFYKQDSDRRSGQRPYLDGREWHEFPRMHEEAVS